MDVNKELEEERARRVKLEEELAAWHNRAIDKLAPDELALTIHTQQVESLTYHLLKCRQTLTELEKQLKSKEADLKSALDNIESLEDELDSKRKEIEELKKNGVGPEKGQAGQRIGVGALISDEELDTLLESAVAEQHKPVKKEPRRTFKDFVQIMRRMERIKIFDAALVLGVSQEEIVHWAKRLQQKGYVSIEGFREKTIVATDKLLRTR